MRNLLIAVGLTLLLVLWCKWGSPAHQHRVRRVREYSRLLGKQYSAVVRYGMNEEYAREELWRRTQEAIERETPVGTVFKFGPYRMPDEEFNELYESERQLDEQRTERKERIEALLRSSGVHR